MGRVTGSYGILGWVRVMPYGDDRAGLTGHRTWWVGGSEYAVEEAKVHGASVVAKLAGIGVREAALKLKGAEIEVPREAFAAPEEGQYYYADLVGLDVVNVSGERLGQVAALTSNGAHDVMEVSGDRMRLLPWIPQVVKKVDLAASRIDGDWEADW